jgi:hypothetical protein
MTTSKVPACLDTTKNGRPAAGLLARAVPTGIVSGLVGAVGRVTVGVVAAGALLTGGSGLAGTAPSLMGLEAYTNPVETATLAPNPAWCPFGTHHGKGSGCRLGSLNPGDGPSPIPNPCLIAMPGESSAEAAGVALVSMTTSTTSGIELSAPCGGGDPADEAPGRDEIQKGLQEGLDNGDETFPMPGILVDPEEIPIVP